LLELVGTDRLEPDEDGRKAVVVRLGEEHLGIGREEHLLLNGVGDADRQHVEVLDPRLLRFDALHPAPRVPLSSSLFPTENANRSSPSLVSGSDTAMRRTSSCAAIRAISPGRRPR